MTLDTTINTIVISLVVCVGAILLYLLWVAWLKPVLAKIGLRNIPRRPAQSTLIVVGLTLSTVIIMSSLSTGDTLNYSLRSHAVRAYGKIDEIIAPPIISLFASLGEEMETGEQTIADNEQAAELQRLTEGGLTSVLAVLEGGLPGITEARFEELQQEAAGDPLIDAVASSIIFPTIIRNVTTGQGEPLGFIFAVDNEYDRQFGLTSIEGEPVEMEALQTGVGNIFAQAANLFSLVEEAGARLGLENVQISDVALATAAIGAALTAGAEEGGIDLAQISIDLETLRGLGIDTAALEEEGIEELNLEALGLDSTRLQALGVPTTTLQLEDLGIQTSGLSTVTGDLLGALNLNTLGIEIDRVLEQVGLQLRQGDVYLNRLGAEQLNARVGDVLEVYIGPIPIPFRVKAIVDQAGPVGALSPVVMLRLDEAQKLLFMNGRVNNVLVSNLGDEIEGMEHTQAVSEQLRILALDPEQVAVIAEILRRPPIYEIVAKEAAQIDATIEEEIDAPPIIASFVQSFAPMQEYAAHIRAIPAALDNPGIGDDLRVVLADGAVREWLLDLPLPSQAHAELRQALTRLNQFDVLDPLSKSSIVSVADVGGLIFTSLFSVFGILSIIAAVLLIFLIFVMMAAERRSEMGVARAIGVQRTHLVQMFVTEGVIYDLAAAALGIAIGLLVSYTMVGFIGRLFNDAATQFVGQSSLFQIRFRAAPTSIVIAYCLGVLFTFVVVTLSAWRISRLNIVAAIRELPEPRRRGSTSRWRESLGITAGALIIIAGIAIIFNGLDAALSLILAGASIALFGLGFVLNWGLQRTGIREEHIQRIVYTLIGGGLLVLWALPWTQWLNQTGTGLVDGGPWVLLSIVLTAPMIILGAILIIMFNADAWTWGVNRVLGGVGVLTPVLKTAIAYPLNARFRTGITMLLFAMVISTVTIMSIVIQATQTLVAPDSERNAGFDIAVSPSILSFFDPLEDLGATLDQYPDFPHNAIAIHGSVASETLEAQQLGLADAEPNTWRSLNVVGVDEGYLAQAATTYTFQLRAPGFDTDEQVWQALQENPGVAVLTANMLPISPDPRPSETSPPDGEVPPDISGEGTRSEDDGFSDRNGGPSWAQRLRLRGFTAANSELPDVHIALHNPDESGTDQTVQVIGVIAENTTLAGDGLWVHQSTMEAVRGEPVIPDNFYVKIAGEADVHAVAQALERTLLPNAANATVMAETFAQGQALTRGILQLLQGFLALGLLVGIAALGVISTRTVVERRQQVGMLRAIGFQSNMVALSFILESSFIALTGIIVGVSAGLVLGHNLVGQTYGQLTEQARFATPWLQIAAIVLSAYAFSLFTTIVPALQAARIYPAEALRYE